MLVIEIWRKKLSKRKRNGTTLAVSKATNKNLITTMGNALLINLQILKMISFTLQHNTGPKAHYLNDKNSTEK